MVFEDSVVTSFQQLSLTNVAPSYKPPGQVAATLHLLHGPGASGAAAMSPIRASTAGLPILRGMNPSH